MHPSDSQSDGRSLATHLQALASLGITWVPRRSIPAPSSPMMESDTHTLPAPDTATDTDSPRDSQSVGSPALPAHRPLQVLSATVAGCARCPELFSTRRNTVFGQGPADAELMFVSHAPLDADDAAGMPLQGAVGELFDKMLSAMKLSREEVYITNLIKCRTPQSHIPLAEEFANCADFWEEQLSLIHPKYVCCLGGLAAQRCLGSNQPLQQLRQKVHRVNHAQVICTLHPMQLLQQPELKPACWEDLQLLLRTMGRL